MLICFCCLRLDFFTLGSKLSSFFLSFCFSLCAQLVFFLRECLINVKKVIANSLDKCIFLLQLWETYFIVAIKATNNANDSFSRKNSKTFCQQGSKFFYFLPLFLLTKKKILVSTDFGIFWLKQYSYKD